MVAGENAQFFFFKFRHFHFENSIAFKKIPFSSSMLLFCAFTQMERITKFIFHQIFVRLMRSCHVSIIVNNPSLRFLSKKKIYEIYSANNPLPKIYLWQTWMIHLPEISLPYQPHPSADTDRRLTRPINPSRNETRCWYSWFMAVRWENDENADHRYSLGTPS